MHRSVRIVAFVFALLLLPALGMPQQVSLTILHTNDTHGHLLPFSYPAPAPDSEISKLKVYRDIGGIARRATLVRRLREELGRKGITVWLMDAGDFSDGTPFSTEYHGEADVAAMNAVGYDFSALGNHEFNNSLAQLKKLLGLFQYPVLCANARETKTGRLFTKDFEVREVGPLKIGIFGLITAETGGYPAAREGIDISGEIETAKSIVNTLRPRAGVIIALSHSGDEMDEQIARAVPGIDVIVGGHSHSRLPSGDFVQRITESRVKKVEGTIIVQAHQWGGELGRLDLVFKKENDAWRMEPPRARLIPIKRNIPEDKTVAGIVDSYWKPIAPRFGEILGRASGDFVARRKDLAHYNLVADAVRETFATDFDLENLGGVRAELAKGNITRADLVSMDPFDNTVVTFHIDGKRLKEILAKYQPAVSGIHYQADNGNLVKATISGKQIEDDRSYYGSINSYFAGFALRGIEITKTGKQRLDVLVDYVRKTGSVKPRYDGRRIVATQRKS
jgi:5'-nucleotidase / UDP-sugar diphosphatase